MGPVYIKYVLKVVNLKKKLNTLVIFWNCCIFRKAKGMKIIQIFGTHSREIEYLKHGWKYFYVRSDEKDWG